MVCKDGTAFNSAAIIARREQDTSADEGGVRGIGGNGRTSVNKRLSLLLSFHACSSSADVETEGVRDVMPAGYKLNQN
jgi:hypothetical protein